MNTVSTISFTWPNTNLYVTYGTGTSLNDYIVVLTRDTHLIINLMMINLTGLLLTIDRQYVITQFNSMTNPIRVVPF